MGRYRLSAWKSGDQLALNVPLDAEAAYEKVLQLRQAGYTHITLLDLETSEQRTDVERLLLGKRRPKD